MKLKDQAGSEDRLMTWDDEFNFRCHPEVDCFNLCCRDVTIFLSPLDVVSLRKALGVSSTEFLDKYTVTVVSEATGTPAIVLRMLGDTEKKCPFVKDSGCTVYESRPYSCRMYPLDTENGVEYNISVDPERCRGLREPDSLTVEQWRKSQGIHAFDELDHQLKDVMRAEEVWEDKIADPRMQDMIIMALYDVDRFREFVFKSSFLKKFDIDQDILDKIAEDDEAMLLFSAQWLRFALFGKKGFLKIDREYLEKKKKEVLGGRR
jgi:uncharacterized protein